MIAVRGLRYALPNRREILAGIDFDLPPGRFLAVLGENGAGKTSLLDLRMGFRRRTAGAISVMGQDPERDPSETRARIAYLLALWIPLMEAWTEFLGARFGLLSRLVGGLPLRADVVFPGGLIVLAVWLRHNARRWCVTL